jgi:lipid A 4'-phosphatase
MKKNNEALDTKSITIFLLLASITAIIFIKFPQIDLFVSAAFYKEGSKFYLNENILLMFLHNSVKYITALVAVFWVGIILATTITKNTICSLSRIRAIYLLLALIIGPGLVVNTLFKDNWGRARPRQLEMFGGSAEFSPAFAISDQCNVNCSFVSGDPSVGFYFLALALAIPARRRFFTYFALGFGGVLAATRVVQGAHFLSDVIFSGVFTFSTVYLLYVVLLKIEANIYPQKQ